MNNEEHRTHSSCRLFVLAMLGTVVVAFLLVLGLFHQPLVVTHPQIHSAARAQRRWQPSTRLTPPEFRSRSVG